MPKINVDTDEFADLTVAFLLDKLLHPTEIISSNEEFDILSGKMYGKGLRALFMQYYLSLPASTRVKYKRLKKVLIGVTDKVQIHISKSKEVIKEPEKEKKPGIIKRIAKAVGKKMIGMEKELDDTDLDLLVEKIVKEMEDIEKWKI